MSEEIIDVIDENNNVVQQVSKQTAHEQGLPHRVAAVLLKRESDSRYLIPTASDIKVESGLFHSAAGHITAGEEYLSAAQRELEEECGITVESSTLSLLGSYWFKKEYLSRKEHERFEVYEAVYTNDMGKIVLNEEQVNEQWMSIEELKALYTDSPEKFSAPLKMSCEKILGFA